MTGPDPIAALAAQLEELRGQLAEFQRVFSQWNAKLETEGIGGTMTLLLHIKQLRDRLDEALAKHQLEPPLAPWWCVGAAEGRAMLAELSEWVVDVPPAALSGLRGPPPALLGEPPGGGVGAVHAPGRVGADLQRRGQQGPAGRPGVA